MVGVWEVVADGAPFGYHVMTFHADGTMLQSNPDHGNRVTSDSNGMGVWRVDGAAVTGAFVEFTVDRDDPARVHRVVVRFELTVHGDEFAGSANATTHDLEGTLQSRPPAARLTGRRFDIAVPADLQDRRVRPFS